MSDEVEPCANLSSAEVLRCGLGDDIALEVTCFGFEGEAPEKCRTAGNPVVYLYGPEETLLPRWVL
jgi:hypothetical protein